MLGSRQTASSVTHSHIPARLTPPLTEKVSLKEHKEAELQQPPTIIEKAEEDSSRPTGDAFV